jgi:hypothetical protein
MPLYARNLMPNSVVSRPVRGMPPMIDLVLGYANPHDGKPSEAVDHEADQSAVAPADQLHRVNVLKEFRASSGECPETGGITRRF